MISSNTSSFNLISEPWIPVRPTQGTSRLASLEEVLRHPGDFTALDLTNPTEFFALHRLLLAICHRAIGPSDVDAGLALLDEWPDEKIHRYLSSWHDHFDLFDAERPFMQVPALRSAGLQTKPWTNLDLGRSTGNAKLLFDHSRDEDTPKLDAPQAARHLLAFQQFTPGGLVKALRTSGTRGPCCALQVVLPLGKSLQETLCLGLISQSKTEFDHDCAAWEVPPPSIETLRFKPDTVPLGPAHRYTWLSRAVLLSQTDANKSLEIFLAEGLNAVDSPKPDPMSTVIVGKDGPRSLMLSEDKAFWRDLSALAGEGGGAAPAILAHAIEVRSALNNFNPIDLAAGGLIPDKAKLVLWRLEERRLSPVLLSNGGAAASRVDGALKRAETVGKALYGALMALCREWLQQEGERASAVSDIKNLVRQLGGLSRYWSSLESAFWDYATRLGSGANPDQCATDWSVALKRSAESSWRAAVEMLGHDSRALAAQAKAQSLLRRAVNKATD